MNYINTVVNLYQFKVYILHFYLYFILLKYFLRIQVFRNLYFDTKN